MGKTSLLEKILKFFGMDESTLPAQKAYERHLSQATDVHDLERRQRNWERQDRR